MALESANLIGAQAGGRILVIMAKAVRSGAVKSRLAACLSPDTITELYRCFLEDTIALAQSLDRVTAAIMCPAADVEELGRSVNGSMQVAAQEGSAWRRVWNRSSGVFPRRGGIESSRSIPILRIFRRRPCGRRSTRWARATWLWRRRTTAGITWWALQSPIPDCSRRAPWEWPPAELRLAPQRAPRIAEWLKEREGRA